MHSVPYSEQRLGWAWRKMKELIWEMDWSRDEGNKGIENGARQNAVAGQRAEAWSREQKMGRKNFRA